MNVAELEMGLKDLVKQPYDQSEFVYRLMELYNAPPTSIKKLKSGGANKADLVGDILWQRKFYFRTYGIADLAANLGLRYKRHTNSYHGHCPVCLRVYHKK
jgi:hypothetical protein